ncbi:LOW QUALITY PROTEIN: protein CMSS1 [Sylvia borin]
MGDTLEEPWWDTETRAGGTPGFPLSLFPVPAFPCLLPRPGLLKAESLRRGDVQSLSEPWGRRWSSKRKYQYLDPSDDEVIEKASENRTATYQDSDSKAAVKKKRKQPTECFLSQLEEKQKNTVKAKRKKKKKISDVLQKSAPKPGVPEDLQNLLTQHFDENRSVVELEELQLSDSCFLPANDLTHSFSSYLKEICPKWAKLRRTHKEKKSVVMLVLCSSALRSLELIKSMTAFKGDCRVLKLFAKHIKIKEQMNMLEKGVFHIGVGTPGRIKALVEQGALCLNSTKYMILDWNWRDQKLRRMMDIPEIKKETIDLLEKSIIKLCRDGSVKLGLF